MLLISYANAAGLSPREFIIEVRGATFGMVSYCSRSRVGYSRSKLYGLNANMTVALTMPTSGNVTLIGTGGAFFGNMFLSPTFSLSLSLLSPGAPTALPSTSLQQTATPSFRTGIESMYQFCFAKWRDKVWQNTS